MKYLTHFFILVLAVSLNIAQESREVLVELKSGIRQKALLIAIEADTVTLGGKVKGKNTVVRIATSQFLHILSLPDSAEIPLNYLPPTSDSLPPEPKPPHDWLGHLVVLPPETENMDSALIQVVQTMILELLRESAKMPVLIADTSELMDIKTPEELTQKIRDVGAIGFLGSQWRNKGDSVSVRFRVFWADRKTKPTGNAIRGAHMKWPQWILTEEPWKALEQATGLALLPQKKISKVASVWVESDPEGALISLNGQAPSCKSPCRLNANVDTSTTSTIWASWQVDHLLWAGRASLVLRPGDSVSTLIKLNPTRAVIQLSSQPSSAHVYSASEIGFPQPRSIGSTPLLYDGFGPGELQFRLTHPGYRDTLIQFVPDPLGRTSYHVVMHPILDPEQLRAQQFQIHSQNKTTFGKAIMGVSFAPVIIGGLLFWMANSDFDRADRLKSELELPSSGTGPNFQAKVKQNKIAVDQGNEKRTIGTVLLGVGAATFAVGFTLWF